MKRRIEQILADRDRVFEGFFPWLEEQYDSASGGFFYARSSKQSGEFTPDIESTAQAFNILERCGLLKRLTRGGKEGAVRFFQSRQDPGSGYFYDSDPNMRKDDVMVGRALGYSTNALRKLGAEPLYPLPKQNEWAPAYMASPGLYGQWLRSISLVNSWRGCDRLCNSAPYISVLNTAEREPYLQEAFRYFGELQHPDSGLWGQGSPYVQVSGTFKLLTFYNRFNRPLPRAREIYRSLLNILRREEAVDMCYIRNPISLLTAMKISIPGEDLAEIAEISLRNMEKLKRADGGYSREIEGSPPAPNVAQVKNGEYYPDMPAAVPLGKGELEGDMNAGTQAILIRYTLRELAGLPIRHLPIPDSLFADVTGKPE
ncbi:hypothetical protein [Paenibacillus abyssi]|uniref:Uncharacterized protein n=1 Tax=Paenibacillus abyssi TaxID=1340531 RepID=A0A917LEW6_9BACL|nr:hypothetical protein [Paenibacillus abyssi]GGG16480.1 hypothetical protein GCM10010916_36700 [Paenibacillus abyssi]